MTRLEFERRKQELLMSQLADILGCAQSTVSRLCHGKQNPGRETRQAMKAWSEGRVHAGNYDELVPQDEVDEAFGKAAS